MTTAIQAYAFGNCTYYVATRFPTIYAWLGNAKDWLGNARRQGYSILSKPAPDTVVVYGPGHGYSSLGHVAVVESVNPDGSFQVSEMNYRGYDLIDQRRSTMSNVLGFIVPPGSTYKPPTALAYGAASNAAGSTNCVTGSTDIFGAKICWDGVVGMLAMVAGGFLIVAGVAVFAAFALKNSGLANRISDTLPLAGGPVGAAASLATRTSTPKAKPAPPSEAEAKQASEERVARAKARLSPAAEEAVSEAKAGRGTKLSPEVRKELEAA
jgi:hypothetical protein